MNLLRELLETLKGWNEFLVNMERLPKKLFQGEFYEEEKESRSPVRSARRKCVNKVRVEDLRPAPLESESA